VAPGFLWADFQGAGCGGGEEGRFVEVRFSALGN
jgi:hypothetical protein